MAKLDFAKIAIESAGLAAGGTGAMLVYKEAPKLLPSLEAKYIPFIALGIGALAPALIGKKNELIQNVGRGMVARAGSDIMAQALNISGTGDAVTYMFVPDANQAVAGTEEPVI